MKDRPMMSREEWAALATPWNVDHANDDFLPGRYTEDFRKSETDRFWDRLYSLPEETQNAYFARSEYETRQARLRLEAKMAQMLDGGKSINATAIALGVKWNRVASFAHKYRSAKITELNERIAALELELSQYRG